MILWCYKWLPIIFGCHCRADRSFFWKGRQFPVCARCTGELIGMIACLLTFWLYMPPLWLVLLLMVPLVVDGFTQLLTRYESTNPRRLLTGIPFGYAFLMLLLLWYRASYRFGYSLTH